MEAVFVIIHNDNLFPSTNTQASSQLGGNSITTKAIISNFNVFPVNLSQYFDNYLIYDQSTDTGIADSIRYTYPEVIFTANSGHNLSHYFSFIVNNFHGLPPEIYLVKSSIIPRHIDSESFEKLIRLDGFVPIYNDLSFKDKKETAHLILPGHFMERNNSWYCNQKEKSYFHNYNQLLEFLFKSPRTPEYVLFAPGANYRISAERIKTYPIIFWEFLEWIVTYRFFPQEAYIVERMLYTIFSASYEVNEEFVSGKSLENIISGLHMTERETSINTYLSNLKRVIRSIL